MTWQWIAGFFEGEGCIVWHKPKKNSTQGIGGVISIGQKNKEPLQAIYDFLKSENFVNPLLYLRPAPRKRHFWSKQSECWILSMARRDDVHRFLENIEPFLFQKKLKANLVIENIDILNRERDEKFARVFELRETGMKWYQIAKEIGVCWTSLKNYIERNGIDVKSECTKYEIVKRSRDNAKVNGRCLDCFKYRGRYGISLHCRECADKRNFKKKILRASKRRTQKVCSNQIILF